MRTHILRAMEGRAKRIFEETQQFWKNLSAKAKRDSKTYVEVLADYQLSDSVHEDVYYLLYLRRDHPKRVLKTDITWPTNRTRVYHENDLSLEFHPEHGCSHSPYR